VSDLFAAFFGSGGFESAFGAGRAQRGGQMQGADVVVAVAIDLSQAAHGDTVEVAYDVDVRCEHCHGNGAEPGTPIVTCPRCHGSGQLQAVSRTAFGQLVRTALCDVCGGDGRVPEQPCGVCDGAGKVHEERSLRVQVPAGIADGQRIRLSGRGHAGERGGPSGDLYVVVRVREDERFVRDQEDLHTVIDVPAPLAALGTTVRVASLDGDLPVEIPAGTQPGETITLRARGLPPLGRGRTGDLHVHVNVIIPRRLSRQQRNLLEQLADSLDDRNLRSDEGMLSKLKRALAG
jgi:molecular chaperone DnaJ